MTNSRFNIILILILLGQDDSFHARRQGYALTMQQGGGALKSLGLGDAMLEQGAVSTLHSSFRWDGQPIGAYGAARRGRKASQIQFVSIVP